jgi:hypothetical protein
VALVTDCLGYQVADSDGRVGTVSGIVTAPRTDRPVALEVRIGLFRPTTLTIPVAAVATVNHGRMRVLLERRVDLETPPQSDESE